MARGLNKQPDINSSKIKNNANPRQIHTEIIHASLCILVKSVNSVHL